MARKEFRPGTVFCAPELLRKGVGVSPVNGVRGERTGAGGALSRRRCESPPAAFWLLFRRGKRNSPKRVKPCKAARRVAAPYGRHGPRKTGARCAPLRRLKEITAEENGILRTAHRQNQQKPPQLFPVLYSNISQKFSFVTIMSQYYGFVTLRPNPLTGGLH